jgi:peroxiredoxin
MPRVESQMIELGTVAPAFCLPDGNGAMAALDDAKDAKAILVAFICNHCPFVKHIADPLASMARDFLDQGLATFGIMSNDIVNYPDDGPKEMVREAAARGYEFPYLLDEDQSVARAYQAMCTPDFYLFGADHTLVYRGQFDGSRPGDGEATGKDLREAIERTLRGEHLDEATQRPSLGCNIKWIPLPSCSKDSDTHG